MTGKYSCSHVFDEPGEYVIDIKAANDNGWTVYSVLANVISPVPGKPKLKNFDNNYMSGNTIAFIWDETEYTTHYNMYFDVLTEGEYERTKTIHYAESGLEQSFEPGKYRVLLQSTNSDNWEYTNADWVYFSVLKMSLPYTSSTITQSENTYIIYTELYNLTAPYEVIMAGYKGGKFITMGNVPIDKSNDFLTNSLEGDIDKIKVMVWDSLSEVVPLCEAEEIASDKFIIE